MSAEIPADASKLADDWPPPCKARILREVGELLLPEDGSSAVPPAGDAEGGGEGDEGRGGGKGDAEGSSDDSRLSPTTSPATTPPMTASRTMNNTTHMYNLLRRRADGGAPSSLTCSSSIADRWFPTDCEDFRER